MTELKHQDVCCNLPNQSFQSPEVNVIIVPSPQTYLFPYSSSGSVYLLFGKHFSTEIQEESSLYVQDSQPGQKYCNFIGTA